MDPKNTFATPTTYGIYRAEILMVWITAVVLFVIHIEDVNWWVAIGIFAYTDLIGYIPGAIAYRRSEDGTISRVYYLLYNTMHSFLTAAAVIGIWCLTVGPEWALLAGPIHLGVDRAVFGNWLKPFSISFEPKANPVWARVKDQLRAPVPGYPQASELQQGDGRAPAGTAVGSAAS